MREFVFMFVLNDEIAVAGANVENMRGRAQRWNLEDGGELESFLTSARAGDYLDIGDNLRQHGVLVCTYVRPEPEA